MGTSDSRLEGVIFDMDGVLCDSEPFILEAARRMFQERYDVDIPAADFKPFVGAGENRFLGGPAQKHGIAWDQEPDKARTYEIYLQIIRGRLTPLPGTRAFIETCKEAGLRIAVATSADRPKLVGNLAQIGIPAETFDTCVNGLEVEHKKPAPDIFIRAAERMGLTAERCLVVEDAPNGVRAGKAAGSRCLGLTTSFPEADLLAAGADWIGPDLAHIPADLARLLRAC